jgi:homoserine dehydrogenase
MPERRRIGFRRPDEIEVEAIIEVVENDIEVASQVAISHQQSELVETIQSLADIVISSEFNSYEESQKISIVSRLINSVALNTELTTKTMLLVS